MRSRSSLLAKTALLASLVAHALACGSADDTGRSPVAEASPTSPARRPGSEGAASAETATAAKTPRWCDAHRASDACEDFDGHELFEGDWWLNERAAHSGMARATSDRSSPHALLYGDRDVGEDDTYGLSREVSRAWLEVRGAPTRVLRVSFDFQLRSLGIADEAQRIEVLRFGLRDSELRTSGMVMVMLGTGGIDAAMWPVGTFEWNHSEPRPLEEGAWAHVEIALTVDGARATAALSVDGSAPATVAVDEPVTTPQTTGFVTVGTTHLVDHAGDLSCALDNLLVDRD